MRRIISLFLFSLLFCTLSFADSYPKVDISGYKKFEWKKADVSNPALLFKALSHLGGYIPTGTEPFHQERLKLRITALLTEKLKVSYDIEQQPEVPDKYDVKVSYDDKHELTFGDFTARFSQNEFASATKSLNGVMITSKGPDYNLLLVPSSKLRSYVQKLSKQNGNNSKGPYNLGHSSIVENSERIELNGELLERGVDYVIDYFEGKITFNKILTSLDEFTYSYEYTNIIDIFLPSLSRRNFFGFEGQYTFNPMSIGRITPPPQPVILTTQESFPTTFQIEIPPSTEETTPEVESTSEAESKIETIEEPTVKIQPTQEVTLGNHRTKEAKVEYLFPPIKEEILAEESAGQYRLAHPIIPFSEEIVFRGVTLRKDEDYTIKYDERKVILLIPVLPTRDDPLTITYSYYEIRREFEILPGDGSRGPYNLAHEKILSNSEEIYVDERLVVQELDYVFDYDEGKILFKYNIPSTSSIKIKYSYRYLKKAPPPEEPKYPIEMTVGATYLRESAQQSDIATQQDVDSFSGSDIQDIIDNDNVLYLSNRPLLTSDEGGSITLTLDGNTLVEGVDYVVPLTEIDSLGYSHVIPPATLAYINDPTDPSDGYDTSTIKMLTSLESSSEIVVTYTYKKSIFGTYTGMGNGSRGPYYITNFRNIVPGSERVEVWPSGTSQIVVYTRNSSFEMDAGDEGYSINYDEVSPSITFNQELDPDYNFTVSFYYVPPSGVKGSDISQSVAGANVNMKFGDILSFDGLMAESEVDRVIMSEGASEMLNPTNNRVTLSNTPVVEDSEYVYLNDNLLNRDEGYFIDYTQGIITFYIQTSTQDAVRVEYDYEIKQGGTFVELPSQKDQSFKYGFKINPMPSLSLSYNKKEIGFDFRPMGETAIGVGSKYEDYSGTYSPNFTGILKNFKTTFSSKFTHNPKISTKKDYIPYDHSEDYNYSFSVNPYELFGLSTSIRKYKTIGDNLTTKEAEYSKHTEQDSISASLIPRSIGIGLITLGLKFDGKQSISRDVINKSHDEANFYHGNGILSLTKHIQFGYDYQKSIPEKRIKVGTTLEAVSSKSFSEDTVYDTSINLKMFPFLKVPKASLYYKRKRHYELKEIPTPESHVETYNTTARLDFAPISPLSTTWGYDREETPSKVVEGENPRSERNSVKASYKPFSNLGMNYSHTDSDEIRETGQKGKSQSDSRSVSWTPLSTKKFKFDTSFSDSYKTSSTVSGTIETQAQKTSTFGQGYSATFTPSKYLSITPSFSQTSYTGTTLTSTLDAISWSKSVKIKFAPRPFVTITGNYSETSTEDRVNDVVKPKSGWGVTSTFKVLTWGELILDFTGERNEGEVRGGEITTSAYEKGVKTLRLNIAIPSEIPVLTSFVFSALGKWVDYNDLITDSEDFGASLWSLEGTFNF